MSKKIDEYDQNDLKKIVDESNSFSECCRKIGYSDKGRYGPDIIKERCDQYNIDYSHFSQTANAIKKATKYTLDQILIKNSSYKNISRLKNRLIKEKRLKYECAICGNKGIWNNKKLILQLDHINGNHLDHRIENLRFLCPNCHSQTLTFSGKNKTMTS